MERKRSQGGADHDASQTASRRVWSSETLVSVFAFLISVATFGVLAYQTKLSQEQTELVRKQQYASVLPYLEIWYDHPNIKKFALVVGNNGVGPAFIKRIAIHYKGAIFEGDAERFLEKVLNAEGTPIRNVQFSRVNPGRVLPAGQEIHLLEIDNDQRGTQRLVELFGDSTASLDITYGSVYEESWQTIGIGSSPRKLTQ